MKKKLMITALILVMTVALLAGCGGNSNDSGKTEFRSLYSSDVQTLNYLDTTTTGDMEIPANCQDWLVEYDTYGNVIPSLAEKWETSEDGLKWTFHLRKDAKWYDSNGEEAADVTAQDFVNAIEFTVMTDAAAAYMLPAAKIAGTGDPMFDDDGKKVGDFKNVGVKAVDEKTLEFTLDSPCPYFLTCMSYGCFAPMNEKTLKAVGDWDARDSWGYDEWSKYLEALDGVQAEQLLNCGPYYLNTYNTGESYSMLKNENYWDADKVYIKSINYTFNAEAATLSGEMYQRGEVESASITSTMAKSWAANEDTKDLYHPERVDASYSYFFSFNFGESETAADGTVKGVMSLDKQYEPENWLKAVNNENFRKSIMYGINRLGATKISDENNAEALIGSTLTPANFVAAGGKDYADQDVFKEFFANADAADKYFDEAKAKEYRDAAMNELKASGVKFPVKTLMVYNPNVADWEAECQYIESQVEALLGKDYIDIIVEQGPTQSFLKEVRRSGKYMLLKTNYGCDYADPLTYSDPFAEGNSYQFMYQSTDPKTKAIVDEYYKAIKKADAITDVEKLAERYAAFADAEAILIKHAMAVPFGVSGGYTASYLNPFQGAYSPYGVATLRFKGQHILKTPLNTEQFNEELEKWKAERAKSNK